MRKMLIAIAAALGLATSIAFAASSSKGDPSADVKPTPGEQTAQRFGGAGALPSARIHYVNRMVPSWSNPTGQVTYGAHGEISLYAPSGGGGG